MTGSKPLWAVSGVLMLVALKLLVATVATAAPLSVRPQMAHGFEDAPQAFTPIRHRRSQSPRRGCSLATNPTTTRTSRMQRPTRSTAISRLDRRQRLLPDCSAGSWAVPNWPFGRGRRGSVLRRASDLAQATPIALTADYTIVGASAALPVVDGGWVFGFFGGPGVSGINLVSIVVATVGAIIAVHLWPDRRAPLASEGNLRATTGTT